MNALPSPETSVDDSENMDSSHFNTYLARQTTKRMLKEQEALQ